MSKKFIFVNADGFNQESAGAYESADFISVSAGSADAGKPIVLDADGNIDASMINDADIDHGSIGGLSDDDHTQYTLADGTRDFSGVVEYSSHPSFTADTQIVDKKYVDDTIQEEIASFGVEYTVASSVTKGDLVYITADDTVATYATVSAAERCPGIALSTASSGTIKVLANDTILEDVLTAATAGDVYYWTGSAYSTTIPSGSGAHVWKVGIAKNTTDLHVEVEFIKRNS